MTLTLVLECLTGAVGASLMHQPVEWRSPLLMTRPCPHPRKPSMPPPPTEQGLDPDPRPAALKLNKLTRIGDSMVSDGNTIAAAMRKGEWGTSTAAPSNGNHPVGLTGAQHYCTQLTHTRTTTKRHSPRARMGKLEWTRKGLDNRHTRPTSLFNKMRNHNLSSRTHTTTLTTHEKPPPSEPLRFLSTNRILPLLALVHHLLEEAPRTNNRDFRNIAFHAMQVINRRSGVHRIVRPRWSFVKPSTCSTPGTPGQTVSSGGRCAEGPSGTRGDHGPQTVAGRTLPSHPRKASSPNPGNTNKRA